jgi:hypothetical protein
MAFCWQAVAAEFAPKLPVKKLKAILEWMTFGSKTI